MRLRKNTASATAQHLQAIVRRMSVVCAALMRWIVVWRQAEVKK
jgi:hypothetical protein